MVKFRNASNYYFRSFYENHYCDALDNLQVYFVPKEHKHIDAFSIYGNCIFCDMMLVDEFNLSTMECISCIAHEVGHFVSQQRDDVEDQNEREILADQYVVDLGLAEHLISALNKMCPEDELTKMRIKNMS